MSAAPAGSERRIHLIALAILAFTMFVTACSPSSGSSNSNDQPGGNAGPTAASGPSVTAAPFVSTASVLSAVKSAQSLKSVPSALLPSLVKADSETQLSLGTSFDCKPATNSMPHAVFGDCAYGDPKATRVMAIYGDSRSYMWATALLQIALHDHWQLRIFALSGCPGANLHFISYQTNAPFKDCDRFHSLAFQRINALKPDVLFATSISTQELVDRTYPSENQWYTGWAATLTALRPSRAKIVFLGDIPVWKLDGPTCLAAHVTDVQACAASRSVGLPKDIPGEQRATHAFGGLYINTVNWVCAAKCEPIIHGMRVYNDQFHFTPTYVSYLSGSLESAARLVLK